jgi:hypothetical protein
LTNDEELASLNNAIEILGQSQASLAKSLETALESIGEINQRLGDPPPISDDSSTKSSVLSPSRNVDQTKPTPSRLIEMLSKNFQQTFEQNHYALEYSYSTTLTKSVKGSKLSLILTGASGQILTSLVLTLDGLQAVEVTSALEAINRTLTEICGKSTSPTPE